MGGQSKNTKQLLLNIPGVSLVSWHRIEKCGPLVRILSHLIPSWGGVITISGPDKLQALQTVVDGLEGTSLIEIETATHLIPDDPISVMAPRSNHHKKASRNYVIINYDGDKILAKTNIQIN